MTCSGIATAAEPRNVSVIVRVLECTTKDEMPELSVSRLKPERLPNIAPYWTQRGGVWATAISVPEGHYILNATTKSCNGHSVQFVAINGTARHVTIALNMRGEVLTLDENMYAGAIFGTLPFGDARVAIWNVDAPLAPIEVPVGTDGDSFQAGHLHPGAYAVVVRFGGVAASRSVHVGRYGDSAEASMSVETAERIVALQGASSGFVLHNADTPSARYQTYEFGAGVVDGWATPVASAFVRGGAQLSAYGVRAIEFVRGVIEKDATLPPAFRRLSAWSLVVEGNSPQYLYVTLRPTDAATWRASGVNGPFCLEGALNSYEVDVTTGTVAQMERCYQ